MGLWENLFGGLLNRKGETSGNESDTVTGGSMGDFRQLDKKSETEGENPSNSVEQLPAVADMEDFKVLEKAGNIESDQSFLSVQNQSNSFTTQIEENLEKTMENWWKPKVAQADFLSDQVLFSQYSSGHGASIFEKYGKEGLYLWGASGGTLSPEKPDEWDSDLMRSVARNLEEEKKENRIFGLLANHHAPVFTEFLTQNDGGAEIIPMLHGYSLEKTTWENIFGSFSNGIEKLGEWVTQSRDDINQFELAEVKNQMEFSNQLNNQLANIIDFEKVGSDLEKSFAALGQAYLDQGESQQEFLKIIGNKFEEINAYMGEAYLYEAESQQERSKQIGNQLQGLNIYMGDTFNKVDLQWSNIAHKTTFSGSSLEKSNVENQAWYSEFKNLSEKPRKEQLDIIKLGFQFAEEQRKIGYPVDPLFLGELRVAMEAVEIVDMNDTEDKKFFDENERFNFDLLAVDPIEEALKGGGLVSSSVLDLYFSHGNVMRGTVHQSEAAKEMAEYQNQRPLLKKKYDAGEMDYSTYRSRVIEMDQKMQKIEEHYQDDTIYQKYLDFYINATPGGLVGAPERLGRIGMSTYEGAKVGGFFGNVPGAFAGGFYGAYDEYSEGINLHRAFLNAENAKIDMEVYRNPNAPIDNMEIQLEGGRRFLTDFRVGDILLPKFKLPETPFSKAMDKLDWIGDGKGWKKVDQVLGGTLDSAKTQEVKLYLFEKIGIPMTIEVLEQLNQPTDAYEKARERKILHLKSLERGVQ